MTGIKQKSCLTLYPCGPLKRTVVGCINIKQQETYEKLKIRDWYRKWYWYFNNATINNDNNNDDNTSAGITTNESNNCNNYNNNNVIIRKIIITIKMKSGCALE